MKIHTCNACGYQYEKPYVWKDASRDFWHISCPCCGFDFSFYSSDARNYRKRWIIEEFMSWFVPELKPENWNPVEQLNHIPDEYDKRDTIRLYYRFVENTPVIPRPLIPKKD